MPDRTVTLPTIDHGDITIPEPSWCTGHTGPTPYRVDISHTGPWTALEIPTPAGPMVVMEAAIETRPFTETDKHGPHLWVSVDGGAEGQPMLPGDVDRLAAALVENAAVLRHLARQLATLLAGGAR